MSKVLIVSQDKNQYFFPYIKSKDVIRVSPINNTSIFFRIIRRLIISLNLPLYKIILGDWVSRIPEVDVIILFDSGYVPKIKKYIRKKNRNCKIILFLWNHVNPSRLEFIKDFNDKSNTWTFVKEDSIKYGINLNSTLYCKDVILPKSQQLYDVVFVGREKGKAGNIVDIAKKMETFGLKVKLHLIRSAGNEYTEEIENMLTDKFLDYQKYLEIVSKTDMLLDIAEPNNYGLSMRVIEALYFNKKLITNNEKIKYEPFYNENNIYIIKNNRLDGFEEFMKKDYVHTNEEYKSYFSIENWIKRFDTV